NSFPRGRAENVVSNLPTSLSGIGHPMATPDDRTTTIALQSPAASRASDDPIAVELFGVPRLLAGSRLVQAAGRTLAELAADLSARYPALRGRVIDAESGWLLAGYTFVVDERFTRDPATPVPDGASVLLVSSVAGG
ncbi:MAG: MoaD/ThiS family protein, partial [Thermomicrobiales bacterium]